MSSSSGPSTPADVPFAQTHLDAIERIENDGIVWRPVRRTLGVTAFGINAYTADQAGDALIEAHDESSPGAGGHSTGTQHRLG